MINPAELDLQEENVIRVTRVAKVTSRGKNFSVWSTCCYWRW